MKWDNLLDLCEALEQDRGDPEAVEAHSMLLREALILKQAEFAALEAKNQLLCSQRQTLEAQVMDMAQKPDPPKDWWANVTFVFTGHEEDFPDITFSDDEPVA